MTIPNERTPLRVPSTVPGEWVYLRAWSRIGLYAERTWGCNICALVATEMSWRIELPGLPRHKVAHDVPLEENMTALDEYLFSLGAEPVPEGEWPAGCSGDTPSDQVPFGRTPESYREGLRIYHEDRKNDP